MIDDIIEELLGALQRQTLDGLTGLARVLEVNAQVRTTSLRAPNNTKPSTTSSGRALHCAGVDGDVEHSR